MEEESGGGQPAHLVESNTQHTAEINGALGRVLDDMEGDRSIPATQEELAARAGCSRGAIGYREDIRKRLKSIKEGRKAGGSLPPRPDSAEDLKKRLEEAEKQLKAARAESKKQFDKRVAVERERGRFEKLYAVQAQLATELRERLASLGDNPGKVLPFRPTSPE